VRREVGASREELLWSGAGPVAQEHWCEANQNHRGVAHLHMILRLPPPWKPLVDVDDARRAVAELSEKEI